MISYTQKLLLANVEPSSIELKVVQVGAMPLAFPAILRATQAQDGTLAIAWRWLPGEEEYNMVFKASGSQAQCTRLLLMRLKDTKPWALSPQGEVK